MCSKSSEWMDSCRDSWVGYLRRPTNGECSCPTRQKWVGVGRFTKLQKSLFIFLITLHTERASNFCVRNSGTAEPFVVRAQERMGLQERQGQHRNATPFDWLTEIVYEEGIGTGIILDKSTGNPSQDGFIATGARISITNIPGRIVLIRYDKPLVADLVTEEHGTVSNSSVFETDNCTDTHYFVLDMGEILLPRQYVTGWYSGLVFVVHEAASTSLRPLR